MGPVRVVVLTPVVDQDLGFEHRVDHLAVEQLPTLLVVVGLDVGILPRGARLDEQGPEGKPFDTRQVTSNWDPLLGWNVTFRNGIRADVTSRSLRTEGRDSPSAGTLRIRTGKTHDVKLNKTYPASRGIKFPWKKTRVRLPNDVNLNLNLAISHDKQTTERSGLEQLELDNARLNVSSGTSYNFTPSITGGFDLAFRQDKDLKAAVTRRGITIAANAQFRF